MLAQHRQGQIERDELLGMVALLERTCRNPSTAAEVEHATWHKLHEVEPLQHALQHLCAENRGAFVVGARRVRSFAARAACANLRPGT
jgi:hypothetical protein